NEQDSIEQVIAELKAAQPEYDYVVINDCSKDNTPKILKSGGYSYVSLPANLGIGGGVQTGYLYAVQNGYDVAVQMDGDGQHDPKYIHKVVQPVIDGEADMVIGSRFIEGEGFQTSFMRRTGIKFLKWLIKLCCGVTVMDNTSGFRATCAGLNEYFSQHYAQDYPEPEAIIAAVKAGYRVKEVPVVMRERQGGVSSIRPLHSIYYMVKVSLAIIMRGLVK
ncbi:MAG: glycosyltransferase family 2 protein, partial [Oscillospiraceae bacterium]|nr:glycosyltransferase family 2 protein [Oscillospiraceae bacterium]